MDADLNEMTPPLLVMTPSGFCPSNQHRVRVDRTKFVAAHPAVLLRIIERTQLWSCVSIAASDSSLHWGASNPGSIGRPGQAFGAGRGLPYLITLISEPSSPVPIGRPG
jgi:hypothetical protein